MKRNIISKVFNRIFKRFRPYYTYFDYYENLIDQINYDSLINKFSGKSINNVNTSTEITFFSFSFNQEVHQIIKKLGKPRFKSKNPQIPDLITFFYRKKLSNAKITVAMHFLNDRLIMGSYIFDSYSPSFAKQFEQQIYCKYLLNNNQNEMPNTITDSKFNHIEIVYAVDYRINFISGDKSVKISLQDLKESCINTSNANVKLAFDNFI